MKILGIDLKLHWSLLVIFTFLSYIVANVHDNKLFGALIGLGSTVILLICVMFHELSHIKMAEYLGHKNLQNKIHLNWFGGLAEMHISKTLSIKDNIKISAAGPFSNIVLTIIGIIISFILNIPLSAKGMYFLNEGIISAIVTTFIFYNLAIGLFNILPIYPMDGGHMLESFLQLYMPYRKAKKITLNVGLVGVICLAIAGAYIGLFGIPLVIVAIFIAFLITILRR